MSKKKGNGNLRLYKSYVFRNKDPVIDELRTIIQDHFNGHLNNDALRHIQEAGGPTVGAMRGWFFGKTQRPQSPTIEAAGRAIGYRRTWTKMKESK